MNETIIAGLLGLLEGLTEFIPVSSTGHILLAGHFLGFNSSGKTFEVLIQLGAILAIVGVYAQRLIHVFASAPHDPAARRFILTVLVAFLPAAIIGVAAHGIIKTILFETPILIASMLVLGGVILLWVDRLNLPERETDAMRLSPMLAFKIGLFQCLAMIPGVSRSGSTIVGAMLMGVSKRAAAEFSFFLSMPTMAGAFTYDLYKSRDLLNAKDIDLITIGFVAAFISGIFVVRGLLDFVGRHGYAAFGWWRIIVGTAALALIYVGY